MRPSSRNRAWAFALLAVAAVLQAEETPSSWPELKTAWAAEHRKLAAEMLKTGAFGFADAQAGLADRLAGPEAEGPASYQAQRAKAKPSDKGWSEADWKAYEAKRAKLHGKEAKEAADLLAKGGLDEDAAKDAGAWTLRLDPDQAGMRKLRGEEKLPGLGWLPAEMAAPLKKGLVKVAEAWEKPEARPHPTWKEAYEIPTEHFLLRTTLPYDRASALAADMEDLVRIWLEIFEGLRSPRFDQRPVVWILAAKDDYLACVEANAPEGLGTAKAPGTLGFALTNRKSFFYDLKNSKALRGIMFHELSHLVHYEFSEKADANSRPWSLEGMAVLMEGLEKAKTVDWNAAISVANSPKAEYLTGARKSLIDDPTIILDMDWKAFYEDHRRELVFAYAHSCGFCHYLMYAEGGRWRQGALKYLLAIHAGGGEGTFEACFPGLDRKTLGQKTPPHLKAMSTLK